MIEAAEFHRELADLAPRHQATVIRSREELARHNGTRAGLLHGLSHDLKALPDLAFFLGSHLRNRVSHALNGNGDTARSSNGVLMVPGYLAPNSHLDRLMRELDGQAGQDRHFDDITAKRTIFEDLGPITKTIKRSDHPLNLVGHSRAGLLLLCALRVLQGEGADHLVSKMFLLSPTSNGIREELTAIARFVGIEALRDLCPDSVPVRYWQDLTPGNRVKVTVLIPEGGDAFTSPERAFVDGGTMLLTPHAGHQAQVRDPSTDFFKLAVALIKNAIAHPNEQMA